MFREKSSVPRATAIIVAAGSSRRMGEGKNKQFILIDGMPVLAHTLLKFNEAETIETIIIVTRQDCILTVGDIVKEFEISKVKHIVPGGETRQESVFCGLSYADNNSLVAIHDGARPFISVNKINELVYTAYRCGASAPGVVPKDTVKLVNDDDTVSETLDRNSLRLIQTPQVFSAEVLISVYKQAENQGFIGTDDCSVAENAGVSVQIVDGEYTNIKVTTPEDLPVAEAIYNYIKE